jgi:hypothetical protein
VKVPDIAGLFTWLKSFFREKASIPAENLSLDGNARWIT